MIALLFLLFAVALAVVLSLVVWARYREPSPKRLSSIDDFRRGLQALAPERQDDSEPK